MGGVEKKLCPIITSYPMKQKIIIVNYKYGIV